MFRKENYVNIPIEVLRTLVTIVDAGSYTRAAERLGLSQPGISAQVKRLQVLVGGAVFERSTGGVVLTEKGKQLVPLAQRLLDANDQIVGIAGGASHELRPVRLGISVIYAQAVVKALTRERVDGVHIHCDRSDEIAKGLAEGYFDVGCLLDPPRNVGTLVGEWQEELVWVRGQDFVLAPGKPIPIVSWPGSSVDRLGIEALQSHGCPYRNVFVSADHAGRMCAVASNLGVMALPRRAFDTSVVVAREYYLPPLRELQAGIYTRRDAGPDCHVKLVACLGSLAIGSTENLNGS